MVDLYISQCTVEYFRKEWSIGGDMGQLEIPSIVPFFFSSRSSDDFKSVVSSVLEMCYFEFRIINIDC